MAYFNMKMGGKVDFNGAKVLTNQTTFNVTDLKVGKLYACTYFEHGLGKGLVLQSGAENLYSYSMKTSYQYSCGACYIIKPTNTTVVFTADASLSGQNGNFLVVCEII